MKNIITLVLLLIGLVGYTQTNSHQQIRGTVFTQNNCKLRNPYNEINVQLFEYDSVRNTISPPLQTIGYTTSWSMNSATGFYNYSVSLVFSNTKPLIIKMTPVRGSCVFDTYRPTYGPWSANVDRANKFIVPSAIGTYTVYVQNVYLIPYIFEQSRINVGN